MRESLILRPVASIRDSLGPISKELVGYLFRRENTCLSHTLRRILRYRIDITEKDNGILALARVRRNFSRSRCFLIEEIEANYELNTHYI